MQKPEPSGCRSLPPLRTTLSLRSRGSAGQIAQRSQRRATHCECPWGRCTCSWPSARGSRPKTQPKRCKPGCEGDHNEVMLEDTDVQQSTSWSKRLPPHSKGHAKMARGAVVTEAPLRFVGKTRAFSQPRTFTYTYIYI